MTQISRKTKGRKTKGSARIVSRPAPTGTWPDGELLNTEKEKTRNGGRYPQITQISRITKGRITPSADNADFAESKHHVAALALTVHHAVRR